MAATPRIRTPRKSRATRPRVWLGTADFAWPESDLRSQHYAQERFLETAALVEPAIGVELRAHGIALCRKLQERQGIGPVHWWEIARDKKPNLSPPAAALQSLIRAWGERWNLTDHWARESALASLEGWANGLPDDFWWGRGHGGQSFGSTPLQFPGWDPGASRWMEWRNRFMSQLAGHLAQHKADQEARALAAGMTRNTTRLQDHFVWLARYQILGESMGEVAHWAGGKDRATVRRAIHALKKVVGSTLRPASRGGRPPKA